MNIDEKKQERRELLERMKESMQEELIACEVAEPEQEGLPPVLNVILDALAKDDAEEGAFGEFYFDPIVSEEDEIQHFSGVITLMDDLPKEHLAELFEAIAYINFILPCGRYCIDKGQSFLAYRLTVPFSVELSGDALFDQMNICMANAVASADLFLEPLVQLAEGEITLDEVKDMIEG